MQYRGGIAMRSLDASSGGTMRKLGTVRPTRRDPNSMNAFIAGVSGVVVASML